MAPKNWEHKASPCCLFLLTILAAAPCTADSSEWGVTYEPMKICAVEGSTVRINCTYSHPGEVTVEKEMWFYGIEKSEIKRDEATTVYHTNESEVSGSHRHRVQFLGNKNKTCSLEISKVSREDFGYYKFRYEGRDSGKHWTQMPGVHMTITDLKIEATAENVQENDAVTLSCKTTCRHPSRVFSWYRDGHQLKETSETLEIQRVSYQDHAKYSCQTGGIMSSQFLLNVQYPPRYAVITGQSNSSLEEGGSVTLYCKALANPTSNYTWVKENRSQVGSGEQLHICSVNRGHAGSYHCEATNRYGTAKSAVVILAFQGNLNMSYQVCSRYKHCTEAVMSEKMAMTYAFYALLSINILAGMALGVFILLRKKTTKKSNQQNQGSKEIGDLANYEDRVYVNLGQKDF
ncbi:B-cell receptor CD22-like [Polypterus senegalus]|uniref:B-cell receptor CD22-like n=1 Tax=Polypterus senegalus TaxID=55291 RepID=UPI001964EFC9|nr:B-cell receptor CD22-like [Polypterus senegalus]